jgi:hypothetical protein
MPFNFIGHTKKKVGNNPKMDMIESMMSFKSETLFLIYQ